MKKNILLVLIALVVSLQASAIRPIRKLWEMTQSDGTTIKVFVHGDGRVDYYSTLDNEILMKNASGDICYAVIVDGRLVASDLIAHENGNRTREEAAFLGKTMSLPVWRSWNNSTFSDFLQSRERPFMPPPMMDWANMGKAVSVR